MQIADEDSLSRYLLEQAQSTDFKLEGPALTEYGWGWSPTISFWFGNRRVHFYYDLKWDRSRKPGYEIVCDDQPTVEIAEANSDTKPARGLVHTLEDAWAIIDRFLRQGLGISDLPDCDWKFDKSDYDKFIPHPPSTPNNANIVTLISKMDQRWQPPNKEG